MGQSSLRNSNPNHFHRNPNPSFGTASRRLGRCICRRAAQCARTSCGVTAWWGPRLGRNGAPALPATSGRWPSPVWGRGGEGCMACCKHPSPRASWTAVGQLHKQSLTWRRSQMACLYSPCQTSQLCGMGSETGTSISM